MNNQFLKGLTNRVGKALPVTAAVVVAIVLIATGEDEEDIGFSFDFAPIVKPTRELTAQDLTLELNLQGTVRAAQETLINSEVNGEVVMIAPNLVNGTAVSKGQVLLQIDDRDYVFQLAQAEQQLEASRLALEEQLALKAQAEEDLYDMPDDAKTALALREPYVKAAQATFDSAKANLDMARQDLNKTSIVAPYDGFIVSRTTNLGDYVQEGTQLLELFDRNQLLVETHLSKAQAGQLFAQLAQRKASDKSPTLIANLEQQWGAQQVTETANLLHFGAALDPVTKLQPVTFEVTPSSSLTGMAIKPGSVVNVNVVFGQLPQVYKLEQHLIGSTQNRTAQIATLNEAGNSQECTVDIVYSDLAHHYFRPASNCDAVSGELTVVLKPMGAADAEVANVR